MASSAAGTRLVVTQDDVEIFESVSSAVLRGVVSTGHILMAAGPPVFSDGFGMVPLIPVGAVQIDYVAPAPVGVAAEVPVEAFGSHPVAMLDAAAVPDSPVGSDLAETLDGAAGHGPAGPHSCPSTPVDAVRSWTAAAEAAWSATVGSHPIATLDGAAGRGPMELACGPPVPVEAVGSHPAATLDCAAVPDSQVGSDLAAMLGGAAGHGRAELPGSPSTPVEAVRSWAVDAAASWAAMHAGTVALVAGESNAEAAWSATVGSHPIATLDGAAGCGPMELACGPPVPVEAVGSHPAATLDCVAAPSTPVEAVRSWAVAAAASWAAMHTGTVALVAGESNATVGSHPLATLDGAAGRGSTEPTGSPLVLGSHPAAAHDGAAVPVGSSTTAASRPVLLASLSELTDRLDVAEELLLRRRRTLAALSDTRSALLATSRLQKAKRAARDANLLLDDTRTALERESWYAEKRYPTPFGEQTKCERDQRLLAWADAQLAERDAIVRLARETHGREGQLLRKHAEVLAQRVADKRIDGMRADVRGRLERYHGLVHAVSHLAGAAAAADQAANESAEAVRDVGPDQHIANSYVEESERDVAALTEAVREVKGRLLVESRVRIAANRAEAERRRDAKRARLA